MRTFKIHKILSHIGSTLYVIIGLLTIGSIVNGTIGLYINIFMGMCFILIGYYLYSKSKSILRLINNIKGLEKGNQVTLNSIVKFLFFENIFIVLCILLGLMMLSGSISRVFVENMPIFG